MTETDIAALVDLSQQQGQAFQQLGQAYGQLLARTRELWEENAKLRAKLGWRAYDA